MSFLIIDSEILAGVDFQIDGGLKVFEAGKFEANSGNKTKPKLRSEELWLDRWLAVLVVMIKTDFARLADKFPFYFA